MPSLSTGKMGVFIAVVLAAAPAHSQQVLSLHIGMSSSIPVLSSEGFVSTEGGPDWPLNRDPLAIKFLKLERKDGATQSLNSQRDQWIFDARLTNRSDHAIAIPITQGIENTLLKQCTGGVLTEFSLAFTAEHRSGETPFLPIGKLSGCSSVKKSTIVVQPGEYIALDGSVPAPSNLKQWTAGIKMFASITNEAYSKLGEGWHSKMLSLMNIHAPDTKPLP